MDDIKELAKKIKANPEKYKDKNVIIGLGDNEKADILFMCGNPFILAEMLEVFIEDLKDKERKEQMN